MMSDRFQLSILCWVIMYDSYNIIYLHFHKTVGRRIINKDTIFTLSAFYLLDL